jgi:tRNA pseudouridine55 synthase
MANLVQLRMLEDLDGFLLVDKPAGIAFSTVVKTVKRKFNLVKVGHGGSLDTMASGLMVLLINDANKYVGEVMGADRVFTGSMRLGKKTNTGCIHGLELAGREVDGSLTADALTAKMNAFRGDLFQTEPRFAAVRRESSAEYEIVDTGEHLQFMTHVYRFKALDFAAPVVNFELKCSKSAIVRSLVDDFGDELGTGAVLERLRRTSVGKFDVAEAIPFEQILETEIKDFASCVKPLCAVSR